MPLYLKKPPVAYTSDDPLAGLETAPRAFIRGGVSLTSGTVRLSYVTCHQNTSVSKVSVMTSSAAGATPTLVRFGIYEIAADGGGTLIAATANDTSLLSASPTIYTKDLEDPVDLKAGQRYALGAIVVTGAALPQLQGLGVIGDLTALAPRITGTLSGQTDLPASFSDASLSALSGIYWVRAW
jgi:hypothetical protein